MHAYDADVYAKEVLPFQPPKVIARCLTQILKQLLKHPLTPVPCGSFVGTLGCHTALELPEAEANITTSCQR